MDESMADAGTEHFEKQFAELVEIFTRIRNDIWSNSPQPDFSNVEDENVLVLFNVLRTMSLERIIKIIDQPSVDWKVIYERADSLRYTIDEPQYLVWLFCYRVWVDGLDSFQKLLQSFRSLIELDHNCFHVYGELLNRIKKHPIGSEAFRLIADEGKSEQEVFLEILENLRVGPRRKKI